MEGNFNNNRVVQHSYPVIPEEFRKEKIYENKSIQDELQIVKQKNIKVATDFKEIKTSEGKINFIESLLVRNNFRIGNIFLPTDDFYSQWDNSDESLQLMASRLIKWLNFCPSVPLFIGFNDSISSPGVYINNGENIGLKNFHAILIKSQYCNNPFQCAAILAHEIMHFYLIQQNNIVINDIKENELLTDLGTIYSGLGILIINSFFYSSGWFITAIGLLAGLLILNTQKLSFGYFKPEEYSNFFKEYLDRYKIDYAVCNYILPQSKVFLPREIRRFQKLSGEELPRYIKTTRLKRLKINIIKITILIILLLAAIFSYSL